MWATLTGTVSGTAGSRPASSRGDTTVRICSWRWVLQTPRSQRRACWRVTGGRRETAHARRTETPVDRPPGARRRDHIAAPVLETVRPRRRHEGWHRSPTPPSHPDVRPSISQIRSVIRHTPSGRFLSGSKLWPMPWMITRPSARSHRRRHRLEYVLDGAHLDLGDMLAGKVADGAALGRGVVRL